jgi:thioesterase domain-containing protein
VIEEKFRPYASYVESGIEGVRRMGLEVLEFRDRCVTLRMPLKGNGNHLGTMYAGFLFTVGEIMGGAIFLAAFDPLKYFPIVKEINIRYRQPAMSDVTVAAALTEAQVEALQAALKEKGKVDFTMDLELKDTNGTVVSLVHGIWQIRNLPEGLKPPWAT